MPNLSISSRPIRQLDGLFSLNDLHKSSGAEKRHEPNRFIRLDQTQELIIEIERCPDMGNALQSKRGGKNQGTYACKELVYSYAMWISAKFHLRVIRAFDNLQKNEPSSQEPASLTKIQKGHIYQSVMDLAKRDNIHYAVLFGGLKRHFGVAKYDEIAAKDYPLACRYLGVEPLEGEFIPKSQPVLIELRAAKGETSRLLRFSEMHNCGWMLELNKLLVSLKKHEGKAVVLGEGVLDRPIQEAQSLQHIAEIQRVRLDEIQRISGK